MSEIVPISFNGQGLFPVSSGKARTKAQQVLIEYLCECMEKGVQPDAEWMAINIYKRHIGIKYYNHVEYHPRYLSVEALQKAWKIRVIDFEYHGKLRIKTIDDSRHGRPIEYVAEWTAEVSTAEYMYSFRAWYKLNLGSLLQQGLLFAIPTGYILKKIDATIEIGE